MKGLKKEHAVPGIPRNDYQGPVFLKGKVGVGLADWLL